MRLHARTVSLGVCAMLVLSVSASSSIASAQDKGHNAAASHKPAAKPAAARQAAVAKPAGASEAKVGSASKPSAPAPPVDSEPGDDVKKEGGSEVKMLEFTGLDIEGQLKTPQMLYFLNRLRAEFGRPRLPHRSFMPELQRGTQEKTF
jgi:hypothetical protein